MLAPKTDIVRQQFNLHFCEDLARLFSFCKYHYVKTYEIVTFKEYGLQNLYNVKKYKLFLTKIISSDIRHDMAEILPTWRKTAINQSINIF